MSPRLVKLTFRRRRPSGVLATQPWRQVFAVTLIGVTAVVTWFLSGVCFHRSLTVAVDGRSIEIRTLAGTVGEAVRSAQVTLGPRDRVAPGPEVRVRDGMLVEVRRAVPVVFLLDGRRVRLLTTSGTVAGALADSRLPVRPDDRLVPGRDQALTADLEVSVTRVVRSFQHWEEPIPCGAIRTEDMTMNLGWARTVREGEAGRVARLLVLTYENGREVDRQELSRAVLKTPVDKIVRVGTAGDVVRDGETIHFLKAMTVTATAYEPGPISCGPSATGYTSLGLKATRGIVAVDPRVIPLWTKLYVDGYGFAVAGDTGSAIKGSRIDVCFDTLDEALGWGVKRVTVYVLKLPNS